METLCFGSTNIETVREALRQHARVYGDQDTLTWTDGPYVFVRAPSDGIENILRLYTRACVVRRCEALALG